MIQNWTLLLFCYLLAGLTAAEYGWKAGTQYGYSVRGRTVTGIYQVANQFVGVLMRAKLDIQAKSDSTLSLQIKEAEYAEIHEILSNGWDTDVPDELLNYKKVPLHEESFELYLDDGIIKEMTVNKNLPAWEVNILKSIVSLLQLDTQAENIKNSRLNLVPGSDVGMGVYKTMEDSVSGVYETIYDISELPEYLLFNKPELIPLPHLRGDGKVFEVVKNRNFSNSKQPEVFHFGFAGRALGESGSNQMGNFLTRTSIGQIIITGNLRHYTIQSSIANEKIIIAPHLHNKQKGMVASRLNLTIESVNSIKQPLPVVSNPKSIRNLVYEGNPASNVVENIKESRNDYSSEMQPSKMMKYNKLESVSSTLSSRSEYNNPSKSELSESPFTNFVSLYVDDKIEHDTKINSTQNIIRLTQEISEGIISPNDLIEKHIFTKFTTLVRILRTMSAQHLNEVSGRIYYPYSKAKRANSKDSTLKYQSWVAFRDAVGQAGTGPALMTIRDWIVTQKVDGEEASQLITSLSTAVRYPTIDYIDYFFEMLNEDIIQDYLALKVSAVMAFTDLVRKVIVDRRIASSYYPFQTVTEKDSRLVSEKYIPYFQKQLKQAVRENNSVNIQLNIRALNNVAHPLILNVFEPYLEGKISITKFQRLSMVATMDKIVKLYPDLALAVLYRIYQNMADTPEIRVAAVMQLIKTNPPVQILQRMAEQTNFDPIKQVNAAVKSAIESFARQEENMYNRDMVKKARAAANMLTPENYGVQYSNNFINSYIVKERNLAYKHHLAHIQSSDSIFPSSFFYNLKQNIGGYKYDNNEFNFMISSVDQLFNQLYGGFFEQHKNLRKEDKKNEQNSKWSLDNIYNTLKMERPEEEPLEGNILVTVLGGKRYIPFDNYTIGNLPNLIAQISTSLMSNNRLNFTKFYNHYSTEIAFPTAMGFPFIYTLETPILINMGLQMRGSVHPLQFDNNKLGNTETLRISGNHHFVYSAHKEGKIGFFTPFNDKIYTAGLKNNVHMFVPLRTRMVLNVKERKADLTFEPLEKNKEQNIFEYNTAAFTAVQDIYNTNPQFSNKNLRYIHNSPIKNVQQTIGKDTIGFAFDVKMESDKDNMDLNYLLDNIKGHDLVSVMLYADMLDEICNQKYIITYNPKTSWATSLKISLAYNGIGNITKEMVPESTLNKHFRNINEEQENFAIPRSENQEFHPQEFVKNVANGIKDAKVHYIKTQVIFEGQHKTEYEFNVAYADSHVSDVTRILAFIRNSTTSSLEPKTYSAAFQLTTVKPDVSLISYEKIFNEKSTYKIEGRIDFGEQIPYNSHILMEGELSTSKERRDYLRQHPLAILCEKQNQEGYKIQPACRNITRRSNYFDNYHFNIHYRNVPDGFKNISYLIFKYVNHLGYEYKTENMKEKSKEGYIDIDVKFGKSLLTSNLSVVTSDFSVKFESIPIHEWIRPLVVVHPKYNMIERFGHKILVGQETPVCTFDKDLITTFDNSSYFMNIGKKPYVLVQNIPYNYLPHTNEKHDEFFSVILRQHSSDLLELTIVSGDDVLIIKPNVGASVNLTYNEEQIPPLVSAKLLTDSYGNTALILLSLSQDKINIMSVKNGFQVIYDRKNAYIEVSNKFRGKLTGLCGNLDGETYNDFITPQKCVMKNPEKFISSYVLDEFTDKSSFPEAYLENVNTACYMQKNLFGNIVNEEEVKLYYDRKKKINYEDNLKKKFLKEMVKAPNALSS